MKFGIVFIAAVSGLLAVNQTPEWWSAIGEQIGNTTQCPGVRHCTIDIGHKVITVDLNHYFGVPTIVASDAQMCLVINLLLPNKYPFGWKAVIRTKDGREFLHCNIGTI